MSRLTAKEPTTVCKICRTTLSQRSLPRHLRTVHKQQDRFSNHDCPTCDLRFSRRDHLDRHILEKHKSGATVQCPTCGTEIHRRYLKKHSGGRKCQVLSQLITNGSMRASAGRSIASLPQTGSFNEGSVSDPVQILLAALLVSRNLYDKVAAVACKARPFSVEELYKVLNAFRPIYWKSRANFLRSIMSYQDHHSERCRALAAIAIYWMPTCHAFQSKPPKSEERVLGTCGKIIVRTVSRKAVALCSDSLDQELYEACERLRDSISGLTPDEAYVERSVAEAFKLLSASQYAGLHRQLRYGRNHDAGRRIIDRLLLQPSTLQPWRLSDVYDKVTE